MVVRVYSERAMKLEVIKEVFLLSFEPEETNKKAKELFVDKTREFAILKIDVINDDEPDESKIETSRLSSIRMISNLADPQLAFTALSNIVNDESIIILEVQHK